MASLESLESELVPAAVGFYLHPDNKEMRACLKILTTKWQSEMNKLHNIVDLIIDSAAYCQVCIVRLNCSFSLCVFVAFTFNQVNRLQRFSQFSLSWIVIQVILDDLQERISKMSDCLDNRAGVTRTHVQGVVQRAIALATQITAAINDIGREKIDRQTVMMTRELKTGEKFFFYVISLKRRKQLLRMRMEWQALHIKWK